MEIIKAEYLISSPSVDKCPEPDQPEYAFIGRSNVGKSSVINMLCNKKELAKISRSPGKTQLINHFKVTSSDKQQWYLVDLPGYGFAKVSQQQRKSWQRMIADYLKTRENLLNVFLLIDSRHDPQEIDLKFINQLGEWRVPFALIFTKADKVSQREVAAHVKNFQRALKETWEELPPHFITSAVKHMGVKPILEFIEEVNEIYRSNKK
jgi:GTP-binding protein